jgi:hypothetical protein
MAFGALTCKRAIVMVMALFLILISILSIAAAYTIPSVIVGIIILISSILGFIGTLFDNVRYMRVFLFAVIGLCIWETIFLIIQGVTSHTIYIYDVLLCIALAITACFTADIIRSDLYAANISGVPTAGPIVVV